MNLISGKFVSIMYIVPILKEHLKFQLWAIIPIILMLIQLAAANLIFQPIETNNGFTVVNMGTVQLVESTQTTLHIIDMDSLREIASKQRQHLQPD